MAGLPLPVVDKIDVAGLAAACAGEVRFDRLSRALYSTDASVYQIVPLGVVLPRSDADVVAVVNACRRFGVPLTARGGGTSQAGQAIGAGVILDCSKHFGRVLEINAAERWARVEPGCVLDELNQQAAPHGLQFAPDISTASRATLGGMIANNSSGTHSVIHGKTLDHVLSLRVVLADGSVIETRPLSGSALEQRCVQDDLEGRCYRTARQLATEHAAEIERRFPKILRRVGGYNLDFLARDPGTVDLTHLFVGSEGTLGVVVAAKVRLVELPRAKALLVVQFADLLDALAATPLALTHGPAAVEVMDRYILDSTHRNADAARLRSFLDGDPGAVLLIEFYLDRPEDAAARLAALETDLRRDGHGTHYRRATDAVEQQRIWKLRTLALGLSMAEKGDAKAISFVEDTAVAPERLRDYIAEFLDLIRRHGTTAGVYAHASVGCLHVRPIIDLKTAEGVARFEALAAAVAELVLKYGGALSGEHGDGLVRSPFQEKMFGSVLYEAFRSLKRAFDPDNLFNPGKIVDASPLATNLRYGPAYVTPDVPTVFDFSADGGLARSAELCAGVGECRKQRGGMMCPSFRATREEQHSTRGRANALRLALTGQTSEVFGDFGSLLTGMTDPALREVFDLCLECKACKSECPTNVDMARLKAEFLHHYHAAHGLPLRSRLFGHVAALGRWGSAFAPLSNWLARSLPARWLLERLLGIDRRRLPPAFARRTLRRQFRPTASNGLPLVLFPDTFANYYEPHVGLAAARLLTRAGCSVTLGSRGLHCCGRPFISNGMLREAVACAEQNVAQLYPLAAAGTPITACEPSCILTLKDDYPALLRGERRRQAETVAAACRTFEEALAAAPAVESLSFRGMRAVVQIHCHQRALVGPAATLSLLKRLLGTDAVDLDAGCCGMAGSFGYEREHYEVSRLVGEHRLFPALRAQPADTAIVASGLSCRLQIEHCTGRRAVHPAELLEHLLLDAPTA